VTGKGFAITVQQTVLAGRLRHLFQLGYLLRLGAGARNAAASQGARVMTDADLRAEIARLREEVAALRVDRATTDRTAGAGEEEAAEANSPFAEQMRNLVREVSALAEETEKGVVNHPLASVIGALVLGILIGRITHR